MRFVNADKLIDQIKLQAGCAECDSYDGVRCRACPWDDAIAIVDGFADNPDNSIEFDKKFNQKRKTHNELNNTLNYNGRIDRKCIICVLY